VKTLELLVVGMVLLVIVLVLFNVVLVLLVVALVLLKISVLLLVIGIFDSCNDVVLLAVSLVLFYEVDVESCS
jgi:hypothetical protein